VFDRRKIAKLWTLAERTKKLTGDEVREFNGIIDEILAYNAAVAAENAGTAQKTSLLQRLVTATRSPISLDLTTGLSSRKKRMLNVAAENNHASIVSKLIEVGVHKDAYDSKGNTALISAIRKNSRAAVTALIDKKADLNLAAKCGGMPLFYCANDLKIATLLLEHGVDINVKAVNGDAVIHYIVKNGLEKYLKFVLRKGVSLDQENHSGAVPIQMMDRIDLKHTKKAIYLKEFRCLVWLLVHNVSVDSIYDAMKDVLVLKSTSVYSHSGEHNLHPFNLRVLLDFYRKVGILFAKLKRSLTGKEETDENEIESSIFDLYMDIGKTGPSTLYYGYNKYEVFSPGKPVGYPWVESNPTFSIAVIAMRLKKFKLFNLIYDELNEPGKKLDVGGETILHCAILNQAPLEIIRKIFPDVNADAPTKNGDTALMLAIKGKREDVATYLINAGVDLTHRNKDANCPDALQLAKARGLNTIVELISQKQKSQEQVMQVEHILEQGGSQAVGSAEMVAYLRSKDEEVRGRDVEIARLREENESLRLVALNHQGDAREATAALQELREQTRTNLPIASTYRAVDASLNDGVEVASQERSESYESVLEYNRQWRVAYAAQEQEVVVLKEKLEKKQEQLSSLSMFEIKSTAPTAKEKYAEIAEFDPFSEAYIAENATEGLTSSKQVI